MSEEGEEYQYAEVKTLPKQHFLCIEFPGCVKNVENALGALGGMSSLVQSQTEKQAQLPLSFRPQHDWAHPIFLDRTMTANFVLDITRTVDKKTGKEVIDGEIVGLIPQTYRFNGIADYQYVPISGNEEILDPSLEIAPLREDLPSAKHFPPPIFTKSDAPIAYNFEDNPFFQVTLNPDGTRNIAERVRLRGPKVLYQLQYTPNMVLPTEPPKDLAPANPAILAHLKTLFSAHPVLFRHHILFHLRNYSEKEVTDNLHHLAFSFASGPWRSCWVQFGYDPRQNPHSGRYQTIDIRRSKSRAGMSGDTVSFKARVPKETPRRIKEARGTESRKRQLEAKRDEYTLKKPPAALNMLLWFHEIEVPGFQDLLDLPRRPVCHQHYGWLTKAAHDGIRILLTERWNALLAESGASNATANASSGTNKARSRNKSSEMNVDGEEEEGDFDADFERDFADEGEAGMDEYMDEEDEEMDIDEITGDLAPHFAHMARTATTGERNLEHELRMQEALASYADADMLELLDEDDEDE